MQQHGPHDAIGASAKGAAVALGNFDGVHAGHQMVIASARQAADGLKAPLAAAVFEPHPRTIFQPDAAPFRLQTPAQRARALSALAVTHEFTLGFDRALIELTAREFAEHVLVERLGVRHVSVGADFRYGRGRTGDVDALARDGAALGFSVSAVPAVLGADGARISSSAIRTALHCGDVNAANEMLTRPWAIEGVVERGFARGREFGFPTLNIALGDYLTPRLGVYAVHVGFGGQRRPGVASIGVHPTTGALPAPILEAHVFDFEGDLYDQRVDVDLIGFLRPEEKFANVDEMVAQIARDADQARALLDQAALRVL